MDEQNKNLILATVLSFVVIMTWFILFPPPEPEYEDPAASSQIAATPPAQGGATAPEIGQSAAQNRDAALAKSERVEIRTDRLTGSLNLTGGRIDDLVLLDYREELDEESAKVTLLNPSGAPKAYYALYGWVPRDGRPIDQVPGPNTEWSVESGSQLTPSSPVTLKWDNGEGLTFRRTVSIDENYMFGITQSVENTTDQEVRLFPYGTIAREGEPETIGFYILHEGVVQLHDETLNEVNYGDMVDFDLNQTERARVEIIEAQNNGWIGFTDRNWMTTLIPEQGKPFTAVSKYTDASQIYQTDIRLPEEVIAPGTTVEVATSLFAGAKEYELIREQYQNEQGVTKFNDSIDWGWFWYFTKPLFWTLHELNELIGNMGWAIIALTFVVKTLLFPLAWKSYVSMARMKELQPEMERIKESAGDDRMKLQQEMMALYKKEKVNPASGCLPIIAQIPIFFSLFKVLSVTIEVRHAPFFGWIQDLSAPDPSSILNLFGLLPWGVPEAGSILAIFSLGVFPIFLGVTMWLQQKLNPAPTDPTQQMIFAWMPWVFMFMLGTFASGLVIYWCANNVITFIQQYSIMRTQGVKPDVLGNITTGFKRLIGKEKPPEPEPKKKPKPKAEPEAEVAEEVVADAATEAATETAPKPNKPRKKSNRSKRRSGGRKR